MSREANESYTNLVNISIPKFYTENMSQATINNIYEEFWFPKVYFKIKVLFANEVPTDN